MPFFGSFTKNGWVSGLSQAPFLFVIRFVWETKLPTWSLRSI